MINSGEMVEGALVAVNAHLHLLSESERKIGQYICKEPKKALHFNVRELAKQSNSSYFLLTLVNHTGLKMDLLLTFK
jgi:hypothetical protein